MNRCLSNRDFCGVHSDQVSVGTALASVAGALVGNAIFPGIGGTLWGGTIGTSIRRIVINGSTVRKRVFVSFDFENDRSLKNFIVGQARHPDSPFEVIDHSLKEAAPEKDWKNKARIAIRKADIVLVIAGEHTYRAPGVLAEVAIAREEGKPLVQIIGYALKSCRPVSNAGRLYAWTWKNLRNLLR